MNLWKSDRLYLSLFDLDYLLAQLLSPPFFVVEGAVVVLRQAVVVAVEMATLALNPQQLQLSIAGQATVPVDYYCLLRAFFLFRGFSHYFSLLFFLLFFRSHQSHVPE
jgi:hypothetical protein